MKRSLLYIISFCACFNLQAQKDVSIHIGASLDEISIALNKQQAFDSSQISISKLKFYISEIKLLNKHQEVYSEKNSYHLIDFENESTLQLHLNIGKDLNFEEISFVLGIDSSTNHLGVQAGDLDPSKGMYWAWQSGYINCKLEGKSDLCSSKNNEFTFHLGGFLYGNACAEKIKLVVKNEAQINIDLDLSSFLKALNLKKQDKVMSPGKEAVLLSKELSKCFTILKNEK